MQVTIAALDNVTLSTELPVLALGEFQNKILEEGHGEVAKVMADCFAFGIGAFVAEDGCIRHISAFLTHAPSP